MEGCVEERFRDFLGSSRKVLDEITSVFHADGETYFLDLEDVRASHRDLYVELHRDFVSKYGQLNIAFRDYCLKSIDRSLELSMRNPATHVRMRELRSNVLGDLVSFSGTVTRTTQVRPELSQGVFKCKDCGAVIKDVSQEYVYTEPLFCPNHLCTNRRRFDLDLSQSQFCNWQRVHVQESTEEMPNGALPRTMDVIIRNELCEQIKPGSALTFTGYLAAVPDVLQLKLPSQKSVPTAEGVAEESSRRNPNAKELSYRLCFFGIHADVCSEDEGFSNEELATVRRIQHTPDLYTRLSESLFPTIHGHSNIKSAILLMLVGGVCKAKDIRLRGDINVLLVGDPGTAKSQFLKQTSALNPRSIYTSGKSSSAAGLTAAVIKDGETGEFTIEAGALMLSDQGICCIDEFDKMSYKDQVSIHEAMEQQTITIAKAGINATLNSRASILAAANPIRGRYDKRKTLRQNVNLSPPIMSRFDLYFVLIDEADMENDRSISRHILQNHVAYNEGSQSVVGMALARPFTVEEVKLYVRYIKGKTPVLTEESKKELASRYNSLRQDSLVNTNNYRMTVRHLESLIRISEALAKIHNDPEVSPPYIHEAYRLLKSSLVEIKGDDVVLTCKESVEQYAIPGRDFVKVSNALVYLLKSVESLSREDLVIRYLEMIEDSIESTDMYENERIKCQHVLSFLVENEGVLFEIDGKIHIHPNYDY